MKGDKRIVWIEAGYKRFAKHGEPGLTIESISRELGKSKSSFYHYFGELDVLKSEILKHHLENSKNIGIQIASAKKLDPDVLQVIVNHKLDFLFHKQLKLATEDAYKPHHEKAYALVEKPLLTKLSEAFNLEDRQLFSNALLNLVRDNFLLRIQDHTLTIEWLKAYIEELRTLIKRI